MIGLRRLGESTFSLFVGLTLRLLVGEPFSLKGTGKRTSRQVHPCLPPAYPPLRERYKWAPVGHQIWKSDWGHIWGHLRNSKPEFLCCYRALSGLYGSLRLRQCFV